MTEPSFLRDTRAAYDAMAADYADRFITELAAKPLDRSLLATFAEMVQTAGTGPVADIGCGPGHVAAHLHTLGLTAFGIDLSPQMIAVARSTYPHLRFTEGSMLDLDLADGELGGIVAMYSIIHIPADRLPEVFAEFHRVLAPGAALLLAFQDVDEQLHSSQMLGHEISLDYHFRSPDRIAALLDEAGLATEASMSRRPYPNELKQRALLLATKPDAGT